MLWHYVAIVLFFILFFFFFLNQLYVWYDDHDLQTFSKPGALIETYKRAPFIGSTKGSDRLNPPAAGAGTGVVVVVVDDDETTVPGVGLVVVLMKCVRTATIGSSVVTPNINNRRMIPSLLHDPGTWVETVLPPLETFRSVASVVVVRSSNPKPFQIRFRLAQVERTLRTCPVIHQFRNRQKPLGVPTTLPSSKPAADEQVAVNQLMKKGRYKQTSTVVGVLQYGGRQHYERFEPPRSRMCPSQSRRANDPAVVPRA